MTTPTEKKVLGGVIVFMILVLLGLCAVLAAGVHRASKDNALPPPSFVDFLSARRARGPLPLSDATLVRPWMTFDYVNKLFDLPADYLKTALDISDSRYPNLSLSEYHESLSTSTAAFLAQVRSAVLDSTSTPR